MNRIDLEYWNLYSLLRYICVISRNLIAKNLFVVLVFCSSWVWDQAHVYRFYRPWLLNFRTIT